MAAKRAGKNNFILLLSIFLAGAAMFASCSESEPDAEPVATFQFLLNGTLIEWNGPNDITPVCVLCGPHITKSPTYLTLASSAPQNYAEAIILTFDAATLDITTYSDTVSTAVEPLEALHRLYTSSVHAAATQPGDFAAVTFTAVRGGRYYDGTFRARLTSAPFDSAAAKVEVVGEFQNVKAN